MTRSALLSLGLLLVAACGDKDGDDPFDPENPGDDTGVVTDDTGDTDDPIETVDAGDTLDDALVVDFNNAETALLAEGAINPAGDRDFYEISVSEGDHIEVFTASYVLFGEVVCDTVLRLYNEDGVEVGENDDMPFRWQETDSALVFQAAYTGKYYVEVLEWGDWAGEGGNGGSSYEYQLYGYVIDNLEIFDNDTQAQADAWMDGEAFIYYGNTHDDFASRFFGDFATEGDEVDIWPYEFTDSEGSHFTWSLYPGVFGELQPTMELYDANFELIASTEDTLVHPNYLVTYDVGIMQRVENQRYYLAVYNANNVSGAGNFYSGISTGYTAELADSEVEPNDNQGQGSSLTFSESANTAGYYFARGYGNIPDISDTDRWTISSVDTDGLSDKYLNVQVMAVRAGSVLDAEVTILDDSGSVLGSAQTDATDGSNDPNVVDVLLPATGTVDIMVEPLEVGDDVGANFYYFIVTVTDEAQG